MPRPGGARAPPGARSELHYVYVLSNVCHISMGLQYYIMYVSGQQPWRAGGPGKSPGTPNGSPEGERTTR